MENMKKLLLISCLTLMIAGNAAAGDGTSGFEFLRTEYSSRSAAMGRAFVAMRGDLNGLYHNPSSMAFTDQRQFIFNYMDYLVDFSGGFAAYTQRLLGLGQISASVIWLNYGDFEETNEFAQQTGRTYGAYDLAFAVSYADVLETYFSYGVTMKYVHSKIDMYTANAIAFDFGLMYEASFSDNMFFGISILNVGQSLSGFVDTKESLPLSLRLGVAKKLAHLPLELNFSFNDLNVSEQDVWDRLAKFSIGGEFLLSELFRLRMGYENEVHRDVDTGQGSGFAGVSLGFGIYWKDYRFDYGFSSYGDLGSTHRFGISGTF
jgi:hypothetical protein